MRERSVSQVEEDEEEEGDYTHSTFRQAVRSARNGNPQILISMSSENLKRNEGD